VVALPSEETAIEIDGLRKSYGGFEAVRGLSLRVRRGEIFAFLGPNGAGKTTTVEILEGFRSRDAGDVRVLGVDPAHGGRDWRARIGVATSSPPANGRARRSTSARPPRGRARRRLRRRCGTGR
jgi:ABC-2 type transport system ATP-binding protein